MSKINKNVFPSDMSWGYGYAVSQSMPDYLIGKIMPIIEIMGLPEKQEIATKEQIKQIVRKEFSDAIYLSEKTNTELHRKYNEMLESSGRCGILEAI